MKVSFCLIAIATLAHGSSQTFLPVTETFPIVTNISAFLNGISKAAGIYKNTEDYGDVETCISELTDLPMHLMDILKNTWSL